MCLDANWSSVDPGTNKVLADKLNEEMRRSALPVTTIVGIETVFGFLGNILILYVFLFHYHRCNFKYFVLCLSFIDTASTLTTMPGEIVTQTFWYVYPVPIICKIKSFFNVFTVCGSAFCLLIISIDRYRKICQPLKWQIKPRLALILCFVQLVFSFILALPVAFFWGTHSYTEHNGNGTKIIVTVCEKDAEFKCTKYPLVYTIVVQAITTSTLVIMFVLYVFVCRKLLRSERPTTPASRRTDSEVKNIDKEATLSGGVISEDENATSSSIDVLQDGTTSDKQTDDNKEVENTDQKGFTSIPRSSRASHGKFLAAIANRISKLRRPAKKHAKRVRRKTLIMFILTAVFIITTVLYMTLLNLIANDVLQSLTFVQKAVYFFFFRLYFINHVINPILYGMLDPHFRGIVKQSWKSLTNCCTPLETS